MIPITRRPWKPSDAVVGGQELYRRLYPTLHAFTPWEQLPDPFRDELGLHALAVLEAVVPQRYHVLKAHEAAVAETAEILGKPICRNCKGLGQDLHSCPYEEDINGNYDHDCHCCGACQQECADGI